MYFGGEGYFLIFLECKVKELALNFMLRIKWSASISENIAEGTWWVQYWCISGLKLKQIVQKLTW